MATTFFHAGLHTLEEQEMAQIADLCGCDVIDLREWLRHLPDAQLDQTMERCIVDKDGYCNDCYFLSSTPMERLTDKPYLAHAVILRDDTGRDGLSALDKVCALLGHRPTPYEQLVSAYAVGGIAELRAAGATDIEIKQITLRDRLIRGNTITQEDAAAQLFPHVYRMRETGVHQFFEIVVMDEPIGATWQDAIQATTIDRILLRTIFRYPISILFKRLDADGYMVDLIAYSNRANCIAAAEQLATEHGYRAYRSYGERTKLDTINIVHTPSAQLASNGDFNACFLDKQKQA